MEKQTISPQLLSKLVLWCLFVLMGLGASAQTVQGTVTDEKNEPLIGASVLLEGSNKGAITDDNGKYSLDLAGKTGTLVVTFIGYEKQSAAIDGRTSINFILKESGTLNEVVVTGYGTQRKSDLMGAVASIKNEALRELPVVSVEQALQGFSTNFAER